MLEQIITKNKTLSSLALVMSLASCGTTLIQLDSKTHVWYECKTTTEYPIKHPCYTVVQKYTAAQKSSTSTSSSSSNSRDYSDRGCYDGSDRNTSEKSGHSERASSGHWECPK